MKIHYAILSIFFSLLLVYGCQRSNTGTQPGEDTSVFITPLGKTVPLPGPSQKMLEQYEKARLDYNRDSTNIDHIIWYGRRTAYLGKYQDAIDIYTKGIALYPNEPRLYRHRGHRYISIRQFEKAVRDLEYASQLIAGTTNQVEPDGLPNALNIPISTLHGNIWYHLGLAYYLQHDLAKANRAYVRCRNAGNNDDNIVSSTHWLYMILRRMGQEAAAKQVLSPIHDSMTIIENTSYYQLCRFYKGLLPLDSLHNNSDSAAGDAMKYGVANWHWYNGDKEKARQEILAILKGPAWNSFGYIAAESDYLKLFNNTE